MTPPEPRRTQVLLITGQAGIGVSTLCWEISTRLVALGVAHAAIEGDELDRVFPPLSEDVLGSLKPGIWDVSALTLAALRSVYHTLGPDRLILSGVMLHPEEDRAWITSAIPDAEVTVVRLCCSNQTLLGRLDRREVGSGRDDQIRRSPQPVRPDAQQSGDGLIVVLTEGDPPMALAEQVLLAVGWVEWKLAVSRNEESVYGSVPGTFSDFGHLF